MGDAPNLPWRLLDIAILIQDYETGGRKINCLYNREFLHSHLILYLAFLIFIRLSNLMVSKILKNLDLFQRVNHWFTLRN